MELRLPLTLRNCAIAPDGGSLLLRVRDITDVGHWIMLVQHHLPVHEASGRLPGRLYWDDELLGVRSREEAALLRALESPVVDSCPRDGMEELGFDDAEFDEDEDLDDEEFDAEEMDAEVLEVAEMIRALVTSPDFPRFAESTEE